MQRHSCDDRIGGQKILAGREKPRRGGFEAIGPIAMLHRKDEPFCAALIEQRRTSGFPSWRGAKARIAGGGPPRLSAAIGNPQNMQAGPLIKGISRKQGGQNPNSRSTGAAQSKQQGG